MHQTMRSRSFYVMTLRANAKKIDLIKFLEKKWGVARVVLKWESPDAPLEQSSALWGTERVDIWEACSELSRIRSQR